MIQRAVTGSGRWRTVYRAPLAFGFGAALSASGRRIFATFYGHPAGGAPDAHATYLVSADSGRTWVRRRDACGGHNRSERDTGVVTIDGRTVVLSCERREAPERSTLVQSDDGGRRFGPPRSVAFAPAALVRVGRALLASPYLRTVGARDVFVVARSVDRGRRWERVLVDRAPVGEFEADAPTFSCVRSQCAYLGDPGHLFVSVDAGRTWIGRSI